VKEYLGEDDVTAIRFDGPVLLGRDIPDGLTSMIRHLDDLARTRGVAFQVGPI